jgi:hypothetical protein
MAPANGSACKQKQNVMLLAMKRLRNGNTRTTCRTIRLNQTGKRRADRIVG